MQNADALAEQLIELQSQLAFQEDTVQRLDEVVARQQHQIDELTRLTQSLLQRLADLTELVDQAPDDQPPPHY